MMKQMITVYGIFLSSLYYLMFGLCPETREGLRSLVKAFFPSLSNKTVYVPIIHIKP